MIPQARLRIIPATLVAVALCGCKNVPMLPGLSPYQIEIQQGNVVTQEMVAKLKPGMTRQQVRFVMGTPPITDPFHANRWDYVYYLSKGGKVVEQRRLVLLFDRDILKRIEGDVVAAGETPVLKVKPVAGAAAAEVKPANKPAPGESDVPREAEKQGGP